MRHLCHRCHAELPEAAAGASHGDQDALLFCPRCGAPQILLPEHMRSDPPPEPVRTTGTAPPPRLGSVPGQVEWQAALSVIALVALVGAVLAAFGARFDGAAFLATFWTLGAAGVVLGVYNRQRPQAWMDARVGLRVGLATGLLLAAAMGVATAAVGVTMRFGAHSNAAAKDAESARDLAAAEAQASGWMQMQTQPREIQEKFHGFIHSPEAMAGSALFRFGLLGGLIVLLSAGEGAFAGMLRGSRATRPGLRRGD
jgi:hypothetical protein